MNHGQPASGRAGGGNKNTVPVAPSTFILRKVPSQIPLLVPRMVNGERGTSLILAASNYYRAKIPLENKKSEEKMDKEIAK